MRMPGEEYLENCLISKFWKLGAIMVWTAIYGNIRCPRVFWDKGNWGTTINGPRYYEFIAHLTSICFGKKIFGKLSTTFI